MYDNEQPRSSAPLDSTTARIVSELASRLVPELTQALASRLEAYEDARLSAVPAPETEETLNNLQTSLQAVMESLTQMSEVLAKPTAESNTQNGTLARAVEQIQQELKEASTGRKEVINAVVILTEAITSLRAQRAAPKTESAAADRAPLEKLERLLREGAEAERVGRQAMLQPISSMVEELVTLRGQISDVSNALRTLRSQGQAQNQGQALIEQIRALWEKGPAGQRNEVAAALMELSGEVAALGKRTNESIEKLNAPDSQLSKLIDSFSNWEGLLRAHSQAQTQELDTLSQELSALQKESGATLLNALREELGHTLTAREEEWEARLKAEREEAAREMGAVKKALWALAGLGLLSLAAAAAQFIR